MPDALPLLLLLCAGQPEVDIEPSPLVAELRRDIGFLASDTLAGRARGSDGGRAAASYLASEFRKTGLPPFLGGYRHEFAREHKRKNPKTPKDGKKQSGGKKQNDGAAETYTVVMQNVLAVTRPIRGMSDPAIVVGAHYDHVGRGDLGGSRGKRKFVGLVHNGADDNASGTAAVLALARRFAADPLPDDARPVVFALFDGEEGGLMGSLHFVDRHVYRDLRVDLMLNLDMVGAMRDRTVYVFGHSTSRLVPPLLDRYAGDLTLDRQRSHVPRSDHAPFYWKATPYLFFHTGLHPRYHLPEDDADLVNYEGTAAIVTMAEAILRDLATADGSITLDAAGNRLPVEKSPPWQPVP